MITLTFSRVPWSAGRSRCLRWNVSIDGMQIVAASDRPMVNGCAALVARGYDHTQPVTARYAGSETDIFKRVSLGFWSRQRSNFKGSAKSSGTGLDSVASGDFSEECSTEAEKATESQHGGAE